ncbi:hypothetical protein C4J81_16500 [Deltaproteobacteria bacterium Smac51]|nr:hypothetical protein C4J81_16500 [Deltaproteobacteria bacterium Smac51]
MRIEPLVELLHSVPKAAVIVNRENLILEANASFESRFGQGQQHNVIDFLAEGRHQKKLHKVLFNGGPDWRGAEVTLKGRSGPSLYWCENHSLMIQKELYHFLEIQEMEQFRALEAAYLHRLRRVADDNLWILDNDASLLWVRMDNAEYEKFIDRPSLELIEPADHSLWRKMLIRPEQSPVKRWNAV